MAKTKNSGAKNPIAYSLEGLQEAVHSWVEENPLHEHRGESRGLSVAWTLMGLAASMMHVMPQDEEAYLKMARAAWKDMLSTCPCPKA